MDIFVSVDQRLDPEGDDLPLDRFVEAKASRVKSLKEKIEPRVQESLDLNAQGPPVKGAEPSDLQEVSLTAWESNTPQSPIVIHMGSENVNDIIRKGYETDTVFQKVLANVGHFPSYSMKDGLLYLNNTIGKPVICLPSSIHKG